MSLLRFFLPMPPLKKLPSEKLLNKIAKVIAYAEQLSPQDALNRFNISDRTLRRYYQALSRIPEIAERVEKAKKPLALDDEILTQSKEALLAAITFITKAAQQNDFKPTMVDAVSKALMTLLKIDALKQETSDIRTVQSFANQSDLDLYAEASRVIEEQEISDDLTSLQEEEAEEEEEDPIPNLYLDRSRR